MVRIQQETQRNCAKCAKSRILLLLLFIYLFIYLPHIINCMITITKRYKNVESNGEEA